MSGDAGFRNCRVVRWLRRLACAACLLGGIASSAAFAEQCSQAHEIDPALRAAIDSATVLFIQSAARGDGQALRQASIPALASAFDGVQQALNEHQGLIGNQVTIRREYLLDASKATATKPRAEFFCGVYGANGATPTSASFVLSNLAPGRYALVLTNVNGGKLPYMVTVVLQNVQDRWMLAGYYPKPSEAGGHDASWYVREARKCKQQGQLHNAWFYYVLAWELYSPVDFMSSFQLDKLSSEIQAARPSDVPVTEPTPAPFPLAAANGHTYSLIQEFAATDQQGQLLLVVKYHADDISDPALALQNNDAVIRAVAAKFPELRQAFSGIAARATLANGQDYVTLMALKDIP